MRCVKQLVHRFAFRRQTGSETLSVSNLQHSLNDKNLYVDRIALHFLCSTALVYFHLTGSFSQMLLSTEGCFHPGHLHNRPLCVCNLL